MTTDESGCRHTGLRGLQRVLKGAGVSFAVAAASLCCAESAGGTAPPESWRERADYLWQSASGHIRILNATRALSDWLADPATPAPLRERLGLAQQVREFAVHELGLPDNASYRRYADLGRPAAVWNVVAAPELSLQLQTWCFPVTGCVGYRGYHDRAAAQAFADRLKTQGLEVHVYGVPAYSTLGKLNWGRLADPLLNTFVGGSEEALARLVFHELSHQVAYADGDTTFNESYASAVEQLGWTRWQHRRGAPAPTPDVLAAQEKSRVIRQTFEVFTQRWRDELVRIYAQPVSEAEKRAAKSDALARMRSEYVAQRDVEGGPWQGDHRYDAWFEQANNARFGVLAAYHQWQGEFERLFERCGSNFGRFHAQVQRLSRMTAQARLSALKSGGCGP